MVGTSAAVRVACMPVTLHLYQKTVLADIHVVGKPLHTLLSHPALGEPQGIS